MSFQFSSKKILTYAGAFSAFIGLICYLFPKLKQIRKTHRIRTSLFAGIQLGGTNYTVILQRYVNNAFETICSAHGKTTADPLQTMSDIRTTLLNLIKQASAIKPKISTEICFVGIACFGPLCFEAGERYGMILNTPKIYWRRYGVMEEVSKWYPTAEIGIDTDVNASAWAEYMSGEHEVSSSLAYVTVGTGVGVGVVVNGRVVHGLTHPQGGHIHIVPHEIEKSNYNHFRCVCPTHESCLEGYVNSKAIANRVKMSESQLDSLADNNEVWSLVGYYLAQLCNAITLLYSPEVIVFGGGVLNRLPILQAIREQFLLLNNDYVQHLKLERDQIHKYIKKSNIPHIGAVGMIRTAKLE